MVFSLRIGCNSITSAIFFRAIGSFHDPFDFGNFIEVVNIYPIEFHKFYSQAMAHTLIHMTGEKPTIDTWYKDILQIKTSDEPLGSD